MTVPSSKGASMLVRRVVLVVGLGLLLALPLAGCAAYRPHFRVNVTVGPKAHQAAIRIKAVGGTPGYANAGIVLTYPDGHRRLLSSGDWGTGDVEYHELDELPSGIYTLTFYSVPARTSDMSYQPGVAQSGFSYKPFPVDKMVKKNIVKSATFVIP